MNGKNIQTKTWLFEEIEKAWERIDQNKIDNAIDSIPGRIIDWISKEGDRTGY